MKKLKSLQKLRQSCNRLLISFRMPERFYEKKFFRYLPLFFTIFLILLLIIALLETRRSAVSFLRQYTPASIGVESRSDSTYLELYTSENELFFKQIYNYGGKLADSDDITLARALVDVIREESDMQLRSNPFWYKITLYLKGINPYSLKGFVSEYYVNSLVNVTNIESSRKKMLKFYMVEKVKNSYTDDDLYRLLLDTVHFRKNVRGITGAAFAYFNKSFQELSPLEQIYLIANVLNAGDAADIDDTLSPDKIKEGEKVARHYLFELYSRGVLTDATYKTEFNRKLTLNIPSFVQNEPEIAEKVLDELKVVFPDVKVSKSAVKVYTHISGKSSKSAADALNKLPYGVDAALVTINNTTGGVETVYSKGYGEHNRALNLRRPAGSMFVPLIYIAAFSNGLKPDDIVLDKKYVFIQNNKEFTVQNDNNEYMGAVTLKDALSQNLKNAALFIANKTGLDRVVIISSAMGFRGVSLPQLDTMLGSGEITPLNLAEVYAVIANNGAKKRITFIKNIVVDSYVDIPTKGIAEQIVDPSAAYETALALQTTATDGYAKEYGFISGAAVISSFDKDGDNWAALISDTYVTVVWVAQRGEKNRALAILSDYQRYFNVKTFSLKRPEKME